MKIVKAQTQSQVNLVKSFHEQFKDTTVLK
jgi:hypothetical protein